MIGKTWGQNQNQDGTITFLDDNMFTYPIRGDKSTFNGLSGTINLGYNKQFDNNLIGLELSGTWQDAKANGKSVVDEDFPALSETKLSSYQTISARLGHIFNNKTLFYIQGGGAIGQIKSTFNDPDFGWLYNKGAGSSLSDSKTKQGYVIGFGAEHKLNERLSLRANYEYVDFGNVNFIYDQPASAFYETPEVLIKQSNSVHFSNLSVGVSYAF